jgi:protein-S-isoprenylcysteine O-methyltransferase Ste14
MPEKQIKKNMHRPDLSGEHPLGDTGQIILFIMFIGVWIADSFFLQYSIFFNKYIPLILRIIVAIICIAAGLYIAKKGHDILFKEIREKPTLINKGVFSFVRHPLYLGAILFYLGLTSFTFSLISFGLLIIIFIFYDYIARYEELIVLHTLGEEYKAYMRNVPRWLPRFR